MQFTKLHIKITSLGRNRLPDGDRIINILSKFSQLPRLLCMFRLSLPALTIAVIFITGAIAATTSWDKYTKDGELAMRNGQWASAEKMFSAALKEAEKSSEIDMRLGTSLYNLGEFYRARCNYPKAIELLSKAAKVQAKVPDYPVLRYATTLNELADIYVIEKNYPKADELYKKQMSILEKATGSKDAELINAFEDNAVMLYAQNKKAEAEKMHAKAKALRLKLIN